MTPSARSTSRRCGICGFPDLDVDQVSCGVELSLVSCPRCQYRYTESNADAGPPWAETPRT